MNGEERTQVEDFSAQLLGLKPAEGFWNEP